LPQAAILPPTPEAAAEVIRYANAEKLAVIPLGGCLHSGRGNLPERYDIALDMTTLTGVVEYEPEDLTLTCRAGTTLGELRRVTAIAGQMVGFDPEIPDWATVGGVLAADAWGASRLSLGAPRDFTIGLRVITGDGLATRAGGRVVKNVAGYDLCKLYVGSLGTLAVITEATFKVQPLPKATHQASYAFSLAAEACKVANTALLASLCLRSAVVKREERHWTLRVALAGTPAAVERSTSEFAAMVGNRGEETGDMARAGGRPITARLAVLPSDLPALLESLPRDVECEAYPTLGVLRAWLRDDVHLPSLLAAGAVVESAPATVKGTIDVFGREPPSLGQMRRLKAEFDPNGVLSPGRFVGRL
jgi:glycolate oxidase FAD binding subunit